MGFLINILSLIFYSFSVLATNQVRNYTPLYILTRPETLPFYLNFL